MRLRPATLTMYRAKPEAVSRRHGVEKIRRGDEVPLSCSTRAALAGGARPHPAHREIRSTPAHVPAPAELGRGWRSAGPRRGCARTGGCPSRRSCISTGATPRPISTQSIARRCTWQAQVAAQVDQLTDRHRGRRGAHPLLRRYSSGAGWLPARTGVQVAAFWMWIRRLNDDDHALCLPAHADCARRPSGDADSAARPSGRGQLHRGPLASARLPPASSPDNRGCAARWRGWHGAPATSNSTSHSRAATACSMRRVSTRLRSATARSSTPVSKRDQRAGVVVLQPDSATQAGTEELAAAEQLRRALKLTTLRASPSSQRKRTTVPLHNTYASSKGPPQPGRTRRARR